MSLTGLLTEEGAAQNYPTTEESTLLIMSLVTRNPAGADSERAERAQDWRTGRSQASHPCMN